MNEFASRRGRSLLRTTALYAKTISRNGVALFPRVAATGLALAILLFDLPLFAAALPFPSSANAPQTFAVSGDTAVLSTTNGVEVWGRSADEWTRSATLPAPAGPSFGHAVATDGVSILVGAPLDTRTGSAVGLAYLFEKANGQWRLTQTLSATDGKAGDRFGSTLAIHGSFAVVGAPGREHSLTDVGAAYAFDLKVPGSASTKLAHANPKGGERFGDAVAVSGEVLVVGAPQDDERAVDAGAAFLYELRNGRWQQAVKLLAQDGNAGDGFGSSVAVNGDSVFVGAPFADGPEIDSGAVYATVRYSPTWIKPVHLAVKDTHAGGNLGASLAIAGNLTVAGAPLDGAGDNRMGAIYYFLRSDRWRWHSKHTPPSGNSGERFGALVGLSSAEILVAAPKAPGPNGVGAILAVAPPEGSRLNSATSGSPAAP